MYEINKQFFKNVPVYTSNLYQNEKCKKFVKPTQPFPMKYKYVKIHIK